MNNARRRLGLSGSFLGALCLVGAAMLASDDVAAEPLTQGFNFGISLAGVAIDQDVLEIEQPMMMPPDEEEGTAEIDAVGGTLSLGFRIPLGSSLVAGIEGDVTVGDFDDTYDGDTYEASYIATIRAILGLPVNANTLLFVTGGVAFLDAKYAGAAMMAPMVSVEEETLTGIAVGGGAEFDTGTGVKIRGQYLYLDFEDWDFYANGDYYDVETDAHIGQIGVVVPFPN